MLPPGLARLSTNPVATGSMASTITIGVVLVAFCAAAIAGLSPATMTSVLRRTSSAARSGNRSAFPLEDFHSMTRFCPSTYPNSRNPWRKGAQRERERRLGWLAGESPYPPDLCALLCLARDRRGENATAQHGDERSPVHYWMISPARTSTASASDAIARLRANDRERDPPHVHLGRDGWRGV